MCRADNKKKVAGIAAGVIVVLLLAAAALVAGFLIRKRKRAKKDEEVRSQMNAYATWQDGMTGDEMQSTNGLSGTTVGDMSRQGGAMRAAAASAAHYVTKTGEEVLPDT
jgi:hypothetical protein